MKNSCYYLRSEATHRQDGSGREEWGEREMEGGGGTEAGFHKSGRAHMEINHPLSWVQGKNRPCAKHANHEEAA